MKTWVKIFILAFTVLYSFGAALLGIYMCMKFYISVGGVLLIASSGFSVPLALYLLFGGEK